MKLFQNMSAFLKTLYKQFHQEGQVSAMIESSHVTLVTEALRA